MHNGVGMASVFRDCSIGAAALGLKCSFRLQNSPDKFLQKRAEPRALLRRQQSSRKLQRFWRALYESQLTTHHLASGFIRTGVPRVSLPAGPAEPATAATGAAALRTAAVRSPIPLPGKRISGDSPSLAADGAVMPVTAPHPMLQASPQPPLTPHGSPARERPAVAILGPRPALLNVEEVCIRHVHANHALFLGY